MCRLQWATLVYYLVVIIIIIDDLSTFMNTGIITAADVGSCTNTNRSVCNSSAVQVMPSCDCGYYRYNTSCKAYTSPVGISSNATLPNIVMTSSSDYDKRHAARDARLHSNSSGWCANNSLNSSQYLQINLGKVFELSSIATQGVSKANVTGYVTSYRIEYSLYADAWYTYKDTGNSIDKIFPGNQDAFNVSCNELNTSYPIPLVTRIVRVYPVTWVGNICIRMELYGVIHKCPPVSNTCSLNATCAIFRNATVCRCLDGFMGDGHNCTDKNECETQIIHPCHPNTTCVNTQGSFNCICKQGYHGDPNNCTDIDECSSNTHSCSPRAQCLNSNGSYSCRCIPGYHGNGYTCQDVNECSSEESHNCHGNASCINQHGTYTCSCRNGFEGDGRNCTDIDECRWSPRVCHPHAVCINTPGSHECRCLAGYSGNGHNCTALFVDVSTRTRSSLFLGIVIGLPVVVLSLIIVIICVFLFTRRRRNRVTRRPRSSKVSRPSSTVIGQIDQLFDEEHSKRSLRDSVSLRSLQFSIPSVHPSLVALNNIGSATPIKTTPTYETL